MNLQENINRIKEVMNINESEFPIEVKRRVDLSNENIIDKLKEQIMLFHGKGNQELYIQRVFSELAWDLLGKMYDNSRIDDIHEKLKEYLISKYKEQAINIDNSLFSNEDNNKYCFIKSSERYGGRGFTECVKGWNNFLNKYGPWLPHLEWNEIHEQLNKNPDRTNILLARPMEKHIYEYYFSIIKITEE